MRHFLLVTLLATLACSRQSLAGTGVWSWKCIGSGQALFGTAVGASDSFDPMDAPASPSSSGWMIGTHRIQGTDGWDGDTGFYSSDVRAPLLLGETKTWLFYIWAVEGTAPEAFSSHWLPGTWEPAFGVQSVLEYVRKPAGVTGGPDVGTVWNAPPFLLTLPFYSTSDGLTGHAFKFTLTMIPEPASILALGVGVVSLAALRRRRG